MEWNSRLASSHYKRSCLRGGDNTDNGSNPEASNFGIKNTCTENNIIITHHLLNLK